MVTDPRVARYEPIWQWAAAGSRSDRARSPSTGSSRRLVTHRHSVRGLRAYWPGDGKTTATIIPAHAIPSATRPRARSSRWSRASQPTHEGDIRDGLDGHERGPEFTATIAELGGEVRRRSVTGVTRPCSALTSSEVTLAHCSQSAALDRPAFVPRTTGRRQEMTRKAGASDPQVRNQIRPSLRVARSAPRTLSRWRHGFEPRWDYE
jgi:hypothetical protein